MFHAYPLPAEVAFDEANIQLMRPRKEAQSVLDDQHHVAGQAMPREAVAAGRSQDSTSNASR
jgi:hypothetical protein